MILKMTDICKDYQMGRSVTNVLKHVDFSVNEGDYIAIMGPSGSGKTTLMNIIGCLDTATSGTYEFDGKDISRFSKKQLADLRNKKIGFVFQACNLLPKLTAVENVALPLLYAGVKKSERKKLAQEALTTVGLEKQFDHYPDQMSGGQRQRVAIARAIVGRPSLILADEPTGALDSQNGLQVMDLFRELHDNGATILMITHDRNVAEHADTIMYIRDGILSGGEERYE